MTSHVNPNSGAIVIGGGIGGLAAGIGLVRAGVRVRLFERAAEFGEVGAGCRSPPTAPGSSLTSGCSTRCSPSACDPSPWS